jgi:hypothetical protein
MQVRNTSRYDADLVRRLVEFGMAGLDTERLAVHVKNCRHAYRGRAYFGVPACSPWSRHGGVDRLITIGLGAPEKFPCDNLAARVRWLRVDPGALPSDPRAPAGRFPVTASTAGPSPNLGGGERQFSARGRLRRRSRVVAGRRVVWLERCVIGRHPYGGKRSPYIRVVDWQEALVAVAAHEARHLWQERHGKPRSEVDCERSAAARLEEYRKFIARSASSA